MDKINTLRLHVLLTICFQSVLLVTAEDHSTIIGEDVPPQNPLQAQQNKVTLDLSQCECVSTKAQCDLTIIKSPLLDMSCIDGENLCCPLTKIFHEESRSFGDFNSDGEDDNNEKSVSNGNVRIYSISPIKTDESSAINTSLKPKGRKTCQCKTRGTCPHKYIDYGFGFYCTYNTVRCCVPEEDAEEKEEIQPAPLTTLEQLNPKLANETNELLSLSEETLTLAQEDFNLSSDNLDLNVTTQNDTIHDAHDIEPNTTNSDITPTENKQILGGELLITEVTNSWNLDEPQRDAECFCLPIHKCRIGFKFYGNSIERRDTLCPSDLIQCCGEDVIEEITKKKDDTELDITNIKPSYPPYHQPIQLPARELITETADEESPETAPILSTASLPPPSLPTHYHNYDPPNYNSGHNYHTNAYPTQLSGPQPYAKGTYGNNGQNIRPWVSLSSPSSYPKYAPPVRSEFQGYPRGPFPDPNTTGRSKSGGIFDTLAQMLG